MDLLLKNILENDDSIEFRQPVDVKGNMDNY